MRTGLVDYVGEQISTRGKSPPGTAISLGAVQQGVYEFGREVRLSRSRVSYNAIWRTASNPGKWVHPPPPPSTPPGSPPTTSPSAFSTAGQDRKSTRLNSS